VPNRLPTPSKRPIPINDALWSAGFASPFAGCPDPAEDRLREMAAICSRRGLHRLAAAARRFRDGTLVDRAAFARPPLTPERMAGHVLARKMYDEATQLLVP